jgi:ATP-dependent Clp protease ATP-binding subunit ClpX
MTAGTREAPTLPLSRAEWRCSFCGKAQDQVPGLIAGGGRPGTFICAECIAVASQMAREGAFS